MENQENLNCPFVTLDIVRGHARIKRRWVGPPVFLIGKAVDCDLVLGDPQFPDLHTYLFVTPAGVTARHVGVGTPLLVDGREYENVELKNGNLIAMGAYEFAVQISDPKRRKGIHPESRQGDRDSSTEGSGLSAASRSRSRTNRPADELVTAAAPELRIYVGPNGGKGRKRISA